MAIDANQKSLFIVPAVVLCSAMFLFSSLQALLDVNARVAWLGAAAASLPLPLIMARLTLRPVPRTSDNLPLMLLLGAAGVMLCGWEQFVVGRSAWGPTLVAMAAGILLLLYVFWYSRFGRRASASLAVGAKLPQFQLVDSNGSEFRSAELAGTPAVLLFYQGNWCPLCMAQIREMADRYQDLDRLGIKVVLISSQPDAMSRELAARFELPFRFLSDEGNKLAASLDIGVGNGVPAGFRNSYGTDTAMPTLIVCNANGTIVFSDQTDNYRVRPEPDVFLAILRRSGVLAE